MSKSSLNFKLGIFVICATILLAAAIIALAGRRWGVREYPAYTTLKESAQGLEVGSPVKFRGVPIGSVRRITLQDEDLKVRVDMELYEGSIQVEGMTIREFLQEQIQNGARCRLEITGITGFRYIEIQMLPAKELEQAKAPRTTANGPLYIPSVRSVLAGVTANVSYTLAEIAEIDFASIGKNVDSLLTKFNAYATDEKLGDVVDNLGETSRQLSELARQIRGANIGEAMQKVKDTVDNFDGLVTDTRTEIERADIATLTEELNGAVREVRSAAESVRKLSSTADRAVAQSKMPQTIEDIRRALNDAETSFDHMATELGTTLETVRRFAEMLEQDTSALLHGKQAPPVTMGREK